MILSRRARNKKQHKINRRMRRPSLRLEQLEARRLLAAYVWDGEVSSFWSDPNNWDVGGANPAVAPGMTSGVKDDVTIDIAGANVVLNTHVIDNPLNSFTLNAPTATFSSLGKVFHVDGASTITAGNVVWEGSIWTGAAGSSLTNDGSMTILRTTSGISTADFTQNGSLDIEANNFHAATLTVANSFTNNGTITLKQTGGSASSYSVLAITSGTMTNGPGGVVVVDEGAASVGARTIRGNVVNDGRIDVNATTKFALANTVLTNNNELNIAAGMTLEFSGINTTFTQGGGTVDVQGELTIYNNTLNFDGGEFDGTPLLLSRTTLNIGPGSTGALDARMIGRCTISGDVAADHTLRIEATGALSYLTAAVGFTNDGTIILEQPGPPSSSDAAVIISSGTLINNGLIDIVADTGPGAADPVDRQIAGNVTNNGVINFGENARYSGSIFTNNNQVNVAAGKTLEVISNRGTITQAAGVFDIAGEMTMLADTLNFDGGNFTGNAPILTNSFLNIGPGSTGTLDVRMRTGSFLSGDISANQTVRVEATDFGHATLTADTSFTNHGTIILEQTGTPAATDATLTVTTGTLTNGPGGVIEIADDSDDTSLNDRWIRASITNDGTINVNETTFLSLIGSVFTNNGDVNIAAGRTLSTYANNVTVTQDGGTIHVGGDLFVGGGNALNFNGGDFTGNAPIMSRGTLNIGPGSTGTLEARMRGHASMSGDVSANQTVRVEATDATTTILTTASGFTNDGTIILEQTGVGSAFDSVFIVGSSGTLVNNGLIEITADTSGTDNAIGDRQFAADVINNGEIHFNENTQIFASLTNNNQVEIAAGKTVEDVRFGANITQAAGVFDIAGTLTVALDSFQFTGGSITGGGSVSMERQIVSGVGSAAADFDFDRATIELGAPGTLDVVADPVSGSGGDWIQNSGTRLSIAIGGVSPGTGHDQLNIEGVADLSGVIDISMIGGFVPSPCDTFEIATFASRVGSDPSFTGLDLGDGLFLRPVITPNSITLVTYDIDSPINLHPTTVDVSEDGSMVESYQICLATATAPSDIVSVDITSDSQVATDVSVLTFDPATNWALAQDVTVTAVNDTSVEGDHVGVITHISSSNDLAYDGVAISDVTASIVDDDAATISFETAISAVGEEVPTHSIDVRLNIASGGTLASPVSVDVVDLLSGSALDPDDYDYPPQSITFNAGDGDETTQSINLSIADDLVFEGDETINLELANLTAATGALVTLVAPSAHQVTIVEDEVANEPPAITSLVNDSPALGGAASGETVTISAAFTDPDSGDTHTSVIDWGDGTTSVGIVNQAAGTISGDHVYAAGGTYTITVTLDDGTESDTATTITVIAGVGVDSEGELEVVGDDDGVSVDAQFNEETGLVEVRYEDADGNVDISYFEPGEIETIVILLGDNDDAVELESGSIPWYDSSIIDGGAGDDDITGGDGNDQLLGGEGDDKIRGGEGDDILIGGVGKDDLKGDEGDDQLSGGEGDDKLNGGKGDDILIGDVGEDELKGGDGNDQLFGGSDDDKLDGGKGDDILIGDVGEDELKGGDGNDQLFGGSDDDKLDGGKGDDILIGDVGEDELKGGDGEDQLYGGSDDDKLRGGKGDDLLIGGTGEDDLKGEDGNDLLLGGADKDKLDGGKGLDILIGGAGNDGLKGDDGDDLLIGGTTSYDNDLSSLSTILAEWSSNNDYATRVSNLRTGSGAILGGTGIRLQASGVGQTVFIDDGEKDKLEGEDERDWFFALLGQDEIKDLEGDEELN